MNINEILTAYNTQDGEGVKIRRIAGFDGKYLDPFLMIDELKSDEQSDFIGGFPAHPHRGIETFTYIIKGGFEHKDQLGNKKAIKSGDVQWMSTGRGVIHSEMPLADAVDGMHGFQIWLNMPSGEKMRAPIYQDTSAAPVPSHSNKQDVKLSALAGCWLFNDVEVNSPLQNLAANGALADALIPAGEQLLLAPLTQSNVMIYIHSGALLVDNSTLEAGKLLILSPGSEIALNSGEQGAGVLILAGEPLKQPIAHMGPFVMTTEDELKQAVRDYQDGEFGQI
ncbi:MAG: pirin family protein [Pseudoalteromonas sp.]